MEGVGLGFKVAAQGVKAALQQGQLFCNAAFREMPCQVVQLQGVGFQMVNFTQLPAEKRLLQPGFDGDVVLVAPDEEYTVNPDEFAGKSHNTPYAGLRLAGRVRATVKQGVLTYQM